MAGPCGQASDENVSYCFGAMAVAAYSLPDDRISDWLVELESIVKRFDAMPRVAQAAVVLAVEGFLADADTSAAEAYATALLADHGQRLPAAGVTGLARGGSA